jgi:alanine-synthesizing transaminase
VYSRAVLQQLVALAEKHRLVLLADEIYDQMVYDDAEFVPMATLVEDTVCLTFSGLSKVYRACGYRVGWCVFSADLDAAAEFIHGMELLAALRLCANVPGQWAVQTALGGFQSIKELVGPGGRLDDRQFAQELLEDKHVLVAPGSSFNTPYSDHFRITTLPDSNTINTVFDRVDSLLEQRA